MTGIIFAAFLLLVNGIYTVAYNLNGGYPQYDYLCREFSTYREDLDEIVAVSYTHLDVYKRQLQRRLRLRMTRQLQRQRTSALLIALSAN